jgi:tetratricopeptide (TPR) repeat protein
MQSDPEWDFSAVYFRAIDEICHMLMHYHPPKMAGIPEDDFQMYQQVVTGAYRAHDMMLRRLIHLAGPDTAVMLVSDHGFHSDHLRPKFTPRVPADITVWHRPQGVFLVKGPGFKADALIHGARLLDIAPTILHHFGLPVGEDMEGRVLTECFAGNRPVETIATWEIAAKNPQARGSLTEEESKALLDQFVALGYIDEVSADPTEAADETNRENQWNLARACLYGGKYDLALPLLEDCFTAYPALRKWDEAKATAERLLELDPGSAEAHLILARHFLHHRQPDEAAAAALEATGLDFANPRGHLLLGIALSQQENWSAAAHALRNHLQLNPQNGRAYRHLAHACRHLGETEQADEYETRSRVLRTKNLTEATRRISALLPHLPPKHRYKILFMRRPVEQVVDSRWKMLENRGMLPNSEQAHLIATQETHVSQLLATLRQSPRIELLEVDFPALVADPLAVVPKIREFLGDALNGELETLAAVVKPELLHHRAPIPEQA